MWLFVVVLVAITAAITCHLSLVPVTLITMAAPIVRLYSYPLPIDLSFSTAITTPSSEMTSMGFLLAPAFIVLAYPHLLHLSPVIIITSSGSPLNCPNLGCYSTWTLIQRLLLMLATLHILIHITLGSSHVPIFLPSLLL